MPSQFAVGIDLGTTNSVLGYAPLGSDTPSIELMPVPQLTAPATVDRRALLPSFLHLAGGQQMAKGAFDLPWAKGRDFAVGEFARQQAAEAPMRTVAAAKSWLSHSKVDRQAAILPWNAPADVPKVSPLTASQRYLEHLVAAWNAAFADAPLAEQLVVLTVPASFDASARELTREAALAAGLPESLVLLEEPQSAVYAWLADLGEGWRKQLGLGDLLLVCDVGGGTTDLTLLTVAEESGDLMLKRVAVGDHLLVGGDNMDLALAHAAAGQFSERGVQLDPWQSVSLWHACRTAKEGLLGEKAPARHKVSVLGRGARLIAKTVSIDLERDAVTGLLADGFFPLCKAEDSPARRAVSGFRELGLPYESDTAVTRHVAAFLRAHGAEGRPARPTHVLFNGGVFKSESLRGRLLSALESWCEDGARPRGLAGNTDLDHAVARGAAYYGWTKTHQGVRIRGGTPRSYYVAIETAGLAIPGAPRPLKALCVAPFGMEEGTRADVPAAEIGLIVGEPAQFRFFCSGVRKTDLPGTLLNSWTEQELAETAPLEATLPPIPDFPDRYVPVKFESRVTELGMFELWCVSGVSDHRWKLEFSVREENA